MLRPLLLSSALALTACSSGIGAVAPPADDDAGGDVALDSGSSVDSATGTDTSGVDTAPGDTGASDTGATDAGSADGIVSSDGGGADVALKTCVVATSGASTGCAVDEYCDAPTCTTGTCRLRGVVLPDYNPVCGCDGYTYWNDHYAHALGASTMSGTTVCAGSNAKVCGGSTGCSAGECVIRGTTPATCPSDSASGLCWKVPGTATCPSSTPRKERVCGSGSCKSICQVTLAADKSYDDVTCP